MHILRLLLQLEHTTTSHITKQYKSEQLNNRHRYQATLQSSPANSNTSHQHASPSRTTAIRRVRGPPDEAVFR